MNKKNAEKEIDYQMIKLLLLNLQRAGLLNDEETESVRKKGIG